MRKGRIEGPEIGLSKDVQEWVRTRAEHACGMCGGVIPAPSLAYRQTVFENGRYDRHYTYCQACMKEKGKKPPSYAVPEQEEKKQLLLFETRDTTI